MTPLVVLTGTWIALRLAGLIGVDAFDGWDGPMRGALAAMFLLTASAHFTSRRRADLVAMVPPRLPRAALLVTVTGLLEILGAVGLLLPATYRLAAACLAVLLLALFPANVYAARTGVTIGGRAATSLAPRTAMQVLFVGSCVALALALP